MTPRTRWAGTPLAGLLGLIAASETASAHVEYVVDGPANAVEAVDFLVETLSDPLALALVVGTTLAVVASGLAYLRVRPFARDLAVLRATLSEYQDLLPWLVRISVGFPLVGAGFAGYYFSPAVPVEARLLQVAIGFLLLFGLATRATAVVGLLLYLVGLSSYPRLLLANEFVGAFLVIVLLGGGRPSADQVLRQVAQARGTVYGRIDPIHRLSRHVRELVAPYEGYLPTVVRASLGLNFAFLGVTQKLFAPGPALAVVAKYDLTAVVPVDPALWVLGAGLAELAVGLALLFGLFTRAAAGTAFLLFTTTLFGLPDDPVLAHLSLYGLVSVLIVTGSGPLALDNLLAGSEHGTDRETESTAA